MSGVREQYEAFPYPERNPEDEKQRLMHTWGDYLAQVNHYCFRGRVAFAEPIRVLVAGGGTGDATVFIAEQLRGTGSEIVHLDFSRQSAAIARRRAGIRGLDNVRW